MLPPGDIAMPLEQVRLAVPGLAGLTGFFLFPTLGSWFRLALEYIEATRAGLGRPKRVSTASVAWSLAVSLLFAFFLLTLFRAAAELRDIESEAAVVWPSLQGALIGAAFWIVYGIALRALRNEMLRFRNERRVGSALR